MPDATIRFSCPACGKRYSAPNQHAGRRTDCPACGESITVPRPPEKPIGFACRLCGTRMDAPPSAIGKKAKCPDCDSLTEVPPPPPPPKSRTPDAMRGEQYEVYEGEQPLGVDLARAATPTVAFVCRVCQTHLAAEVTRVGEFVQCPDCRAETRVPPPRELPKKPSQPDNDAYAVDESEPAPTPHAGLYEEYADKRPIGYRQSDDDESAKRKTRVERTADPSTAPRWGLGFFVGFTECFFTPGMAGAFFGLFALSSLMLTAMLATQLGGMIQMAFMLLGIVLGIIVTLLWTGLMATVCWNVLSDVSGGARRVTDWLTIDASEWIAPSISLLIALALSMTPGLMLGGALPFVVIPGGVPLWVVSLWLLLPWVLLSQLDTSSWWGVFSGRIAMSFRHAPFTWCVFYALTALLLVGGAALEQWILNSANVWLLYVSCALDVAVPLLYAWWLGRLAWTAGAATPTKAAEPD